MRSPSPAEPGGSVPGSAGRPGRATSGAAPASALGGRRSGARFGQGLAAAAAPVLASVAEAAWIAVLVAAAMAAMGGAEATGPLLPVVVAALIGFATARLLPGGPARAPILL